MYIEAIQYLSTRSQTSTFPLALVTKNTPGLVGDQAPPVRGTMELWDLSKASFYMERKFKTIKTLWLFKSTRMQCKCRKMTIIVCCFSIDVQLFFSASKSILLQESKSILLQESKSILLQESKSILLQESKSILLQESKSILLRENKVKLTLAPSFQRAHVQPPTDKRISLKNGDLSMHEIGPWWVRNWYRGGEGTYFPLSESLTGIQLQ